MKRISSYFAPAGEKRAKPTATEENQNEAITTNLENPSECGIEGQKKNESSGSAGVPATCSTQVSTARTCVLFG
jgi:hypothetical protein